ncbi:MAG: ribosome biogenesis GTPase Der [Alphaproteobacteria bacterium]|jgi:GTP-binding protein|nr:ribosome biogenesis GTPase Der [Alphaproteobacteria bacterium]
MALTIAIVGRPNVGKSTLFNRLVGRRAALVDDRPGVTRDWREGAGRLGPSQFRVIDTAGLEDADADSLEARMQASTEAVLGEADLVLMVTDARAGLTPLDRHFADWLRRHDLPLRLVVNKAEGKAGDAGVAEAWALGLGEPVAISAEHGEGMGDLYAALVSALPALEADAGEAVDDDGEGPLRIAVVGRPNVGKSTLINRLLGGERLLVGPEAGITRDAVEIPWRWRDRDVVLVDTAGMRKRARVVETLEKLSVGDSLRSIRACHVAVLMVDVTHSLERQDLTIASLIANEGRAPLIAANKWDLIEHPDVVRRQLAEQVEAALPQLRGLRAIPISARDGMGLDDLLEAAFAVREVWAKRLPTAKLNQWLEGVLAHHPPPMDKGKRVKMRYLTQVSARPPTLALFVNRPKGVPESYRRYLINELRDTFGLLGTPIRLNFRGGKNPYASNTG